MGRSVSLTHVPRYCTRCVSRASPVPTPAPTGAPPPAPSAAPAAAAAPVPASGSRLASREPSVVLCKDHQQGQLSTSWGNLISMVLRSHPFPRPERPQGRAPRAALEGPSHPGAALSSENRESAAPPEEDRHGAEDLATRAGPGGLEEAGARPQQSHTETEGAAAEGTPSGPRGANHKESTRIPSLGRDDPLEKAMATHSHILAWKIPWMEEPGGLPRFESAEV